jgi:4-amino-4-deoxy-L-arabinose transferase-like glycosyltransferase
MSPTAVRAFVRDERAPRLVTAAVLLALVVAYAIGLPHHGNYWDEEVQRVYGMSVLDWYLSGFSDTTFMELGDLRLYGGLVELVLEALAAVVPGNPWLIRHTAVAGLTVLAVWGVQRLGTLMGGPWLGVLGMVLLATSPRFFGHGFFNSKDIPTAAFYVLTVLAFARDLRRPVGAPLRTVLPASVVLGMLLGSRVGATIVFPALLSGYLVKWWRSGRTRSAFVFLVSRFGVAFVVGWSIMLVAWPWAVQRPLVYPLVALLASGRFPWRYEQLFGGEFVSSLELPVSYVPTWFGLILPEIVLGGVFVAVLTLAWRLVQRRIAWTPELVLVLMASLLPLFYVIVSGAALYDEVRHLLFLQPFIALAAAFGVVTALRAAADRGPGPLAAAGLAVLGGILLPVVETVRMAPYEYVYFNAVSGGLRAAAGRYELDYWGLSYREGVEWLEDNHAPAGTRIANCSHPGTTWPFVDPPLRYVGSPFFGMEGEPDWLLLTAPHDCSRHPLPPEEFPVAGEVFPVVTRHGVTLLRAIRVTEFGPMPDSARVPGAGS